MEANQKSLKFVVAMDAHELKITKDRTKHLEKERTDLNTRLHS